MIILSINNNEESITLPIHPPGVGPSKTKAPIEFKTFRNGTILLDVLGGLRTLSIDSFFPETSNKYTFQDKNSLDAMEYVKIINKWIDIKIPIRIKIFLGSNLFLNMPCTITDFTPLPDKVNDIKYTLGIKEFPIIS